MRFEIARDRSQLVKSVAFELVSTVNRLHDTLPVVNLMLTGGSVANEVYSACAELMEQPVAMPRLYLWWGDERFVPTDDDQRNDAAAMQALRRVWDLHADQIRPMGSPHEFEDADTAAWHYQRDLEAVTIDLCLLGMGPDGHVASIFPDHASFAPSGPEVMAVVDSPKPPPIRLSLSIERINEARQVWFIVAGADKAEAVAGAVSGRRDLPAGVARGAEETTWWLDEQAAGMLPHEDEDTIALKRGAR